MQAITSEHRCLLSLAETLDARLERTPEPDYAELRGLAGELRRRFIEVHLPKEQLIVDRLLAHAGATRTLLATFMNDHGLTFLDALAHFERDIDTLLLDQIVDRKQLHEHGRQALTHLRAQIAAEEASSLPWATKSLEPRDWMRIDAGVHAVHARCDLEPPPARQDARR
jgi:hemerythrin-like domain-containing protein